MILKEYSHTNIKVCLLANRYYVCYFSPDTKRVDRLFVTYNHKEMLQAYFLARYLFIRFNHATYWRSEKELLNDNHSFFKEYFEGL